MSVVTLSELLGAAVRDPSGAVRGRVREVAIVPHRPAGIAHGRAEKLRESDQGHENSQLSRDAATAVNTK